MQPVVVWSSQGHLQGDLKVANISMHMRLTWRSQFNPESACDQQGIMRIMVLLHRTVKCDAEISHKPPEYLVESVSLVSKQNSDYELLRCLLLPSTTPTKKELYILIAFKHPSFFFLWSSALSSLWVFPKQHLPHRLCKLIWHLTSLKIIWPQNMKQYHSNIQGTHWMAASDIRSWHHWVVMRMHFIRKSAWWAWVKRMCTITAVFLCLFSKCRLWFPPPPMPRGHPSHCKIVLHGAFHSRLDFLFTAGCGVIYSLKVHPSMELSTLKRWGWILTDSAINFVPVVESWLILYQIAEHLWHQSKVSHLPIQWITIRRILGHCREACRIAKWLSHLSNRQDFARWLATLRQAK